MPSLIELDKSLLKLVLFKYSKSMDEIANWALKSLSALSSKVWIKTPLSS